MIRSSNGSHAVYVYVNGKKKYVGSYSSRKEAESAERREKVTQEMIEAGELAPETDSKRTLRAAVKEWLDSLAANKSRSHKAYEIRMNLYILPALGDVPIARMTKPQVLRWRDTQASQFSVSTVNGSLTCLSSAFSYFVDQQWLDVNPCHGVERAKTRRVYEWIKTRPEITKLLIECPKGIREMCTLALSTGMRLDELIHLQWDDIDLPNRLITVHRGRQGTTKSGEPRYIPILDTLLPFLRSLQLHRGGAVLVFPGAKGKVRSKPGVRVPFKQAARRAGLPPKLRFHDLRHTFASHWVLDGGDIFRLSKILGHSSVVITQKTYAHLVPEMWEQDYHRVSFVVPEDAEYGVTKKPHLIAI
ncbi:MAG: tyrosine-type recombinase/integrase [Kofleriaceae bacterium]